MRALRLLLIGLLGVAPAARAEAPEAAAAVRDESARLMKPVHGYPQIKRLWLERRSALEHGDLERADEIYARVAVQRKDNAIRSLDPFAASLLREARATVDAGKLDRAGQLLEQARGIAPDLPETEAFAASLEIARQPLAVHKWFVHRVRQVVHKLRNFQRRVLLLSDVILTSLLVLAVLGVTFLLVQLLRHGLSIYHDLGQVLPSMARFLIIAAMVVLALLPLVYGFGPYLLFFPLAVLLWPYQRRTERVLTLVFTLLLGGAPWLLRMGDRLSAAGTGLSEALYTLTRNPGEPRALHTVEAAIEESPKDWEAQAILGVAYKQQGRLDVAQETLEKALEHAPRDAAVLGHIENNLGNVRFAEGYVSLAEKHYKAAAQREPKAAAPVFNLHRLYKRMGQAEAAREAMDRASALEPDRVAEWSDDSELNLNRYVVDMDVGEDTLTRRELSALFSPTPLASRFWQVLAGPVPEITAPTLGGVSLLAFLVIWIRRKRIRLSQPCARCARPAYRFIDEYEPTLLCEQCENLFVRNLPVDRRIRFQKEEEIARYRSLQRWGTRAAGVLFPGLAGLLRGLTLRGALMMALALVLLIRVFLPEGLLGEPAPATSSGNLALYLTLGALGVLWILSILRALRMTRDTA